jgi:Pentapeptide repeats (8 copies)
MRRALLAMVVVCALLGSVTGVLLTPTVVAGRAHAEPVDYERIVQDEALWVSTAQLSCAGEGDGAIAEAQITEAQLTAAQLTGAQLTGAQLTGAQLTGAQLAGPGSVSVHPYEANLGARAMLAAGPRYFPMVRRYLQWYLRHLNRPDVNGLVGTVYDYDYDPRTCLGAPQPHPITGERPKYDSTDAYAGTFLTLVAEYARANPVDHEFFRSPAVRADLEWIAEAVGATRGPSGLTGATPTYPAEYLMDNVEAQRGIEDYAWLLHAVLGDPAAAQVRYAEAGRIRDAIEARLWLAAGMYGWAADQLNPSWDTWFPDSVAQLWPVLDGLAGGGRPAALWAAFSRRWPMWTRSRPEYGAVDVEHDPNAGVAYAAARVGDRAAVDDYLRSSEEFWARPGRPPPWTVDDAGFRALAARTMAGTTPRR